MDCKTVEKTISSLLLSRPLIDLISDSFSVELYEHIESCNSCNRKHALNKRLLMKMNSHYKNIKASVKLKNKIWSEIKKETSKVYLWVKPTALVACAVLIIGIGIFAQKTFLELPTIYEAHHIVNYHLFSTDIEELIEHTGLDLKKQHFSNFEKAAFIPHGASKIQKPLNKTLGTIALKNDKGQKLTLCFYPENHKFSHRGVTNVDGTKVYHGNTGSQNFAYWFTDEMTIVLISDNLLPQEMIDLATPLINGSEV